jgi:hypothetical protein
VLSGANLSLLLFTFTSDVIWPKLPGTEMTAHWMRGIRRIVVERQVRIGELIVVEDVERLSREYQGEALGKLDLLFERDINLPGERSGDDAAARVSKSLGERLHDEPPVKPGAPTKEVAPEPKTKRGKKEK